MTEITTSPTKEDNITPVDLEKKSDVKQETEAVQTENEVSDSKPKDKEVKSIDNGYLHKSPKKLLGMSHWSKSYFAFGVESQAIPLSNLKTYYRKNVRRSIPKPVGAGNTTSNTTETEAKVDDSAKVDESKKADESTKVDDSAKVDEPAKVDDSAKVDEPAKVDESTKVDESKKVEESTSSDVVEEVKVDDKPKEDDSKKPADDKKQSETKEEETVTEYVRVVCRNIAHASQTGEGLLFYFKSETESQKNIPHGIINLKDVIDVKSHEHVGKQKQFAFEIVTKHRNFELAADKEEDRESWIKSIKERSDKAKESPDTLDTGKFHETYDKLAKGTAFSEVSRHTGETSDEPFSGEDEPVADKSRSVESNKRKSSFLSFAFGGKKALTTEPSTTSTTITENTEEDGSKVVTTTTITTENLTDETEENKSGEPKSPLRASKILNFFKTTQSSPKPDDEKAKTADETTNAETSNAAAATNGAEHPEVEKKKHNYFEGFMKKKETPKDESKENKEVASNAEQGEQTEGKTETTETPTDESAQQKEGSSGFFKNIFKPKSTGETSETKAEPTEPSADVTNTEVKNDGSKVAEETSGPSDVEDKDKDKEKGDKTDKTDTAEPSLVRRVTTKIFGGKRAKSPKADDKKSESIREVIENEDKKEETSETKPTENADATAQTTEQTTEQATEQATEQTTEQATEQTAEQTTGPESSAETENKKKSIFNFGRRKSGGVKKENSEPQVEKAEKSEIEGEAVASATEATDEVTNEEKADKVEKSGQKAVFPDEKRIKKSGHLHKQTGLLRSFEQRYFVLTDDKKLYYYRSNTDASTQKSIDVVKVKIGDGNKFDLETKTRSYKLNADSEGDRESWIKVFKELGFEIESHESTSESRDVKDVTQKLDVVPSGSGNENDIEQSVKEAADKSADAADAKVSETQETTTQATKDKVEETTEEITTVTKETTETVEVSS